MFRLRFSALCLAVLMGLGATAMAASISDRVEFAHHRIEQGIRSGSLTRLEAQRLREEFARVRRDEAHALADGRLDQRERQQLNWELDRLERDISRFKNNDVHRGDHREDRRWR